MSMLKRSLLRVVGPKLLIEARVADVLQVSESFRFIEIEAEELKSVRLQPGGKVQINTGDWNLRTYTPFSVDAELGRLGILAYVNGRGPGSKWAQNVQSGDTCYLRGPSQSLSFPEIRGPLLFFGDETSLAAATTLKRSLRSDSKAFFMFEANRPQEVKKIVQDLGFEQVLVLEKTTDGVMTESALQSFLKAARKFPSGQVILSGRAGSVKVLRERLKETDGLDLRIQAKPYWAEGKTGFD